LKGLRPGAANLRQRAKAKVRIRMRGKEGKEAKANNPGSSVFAGGVHEWWGLTTYLIASLYLISITPS